MKIYEPMEEVSSGTPYLLTSFLSFLFLVFIHGLAFLYPYGSNSLVIITRHSRGSMMMNLRIQIQTLCPFPFSYHVYLLLMHFHFRFCRWRHNDNWQKPYWFYYGLRDCFWRVPTVVLPYLHDVPQNKRISKYDLKLLTLLEGIMSWYYLFALLLLSLDI